MEPRHKRIAAWTGVAITAGSSALLGGLALRDRMFQRFDAAEAERYSRRPGDDLVADAQVHDDHGVTVDAPVDEVWSRVQRLAAESGLKVALSEEPKFVVVTGSAGMSVGFYMRPEHGLDGWPKTRLHVRQRHSAGSLGAKAQMRLTTGITTAMTWRMLRDLSVPTTSDGTHGGDESVVLGEDSGTNRD
ncbi:hypothetical protein [Corynebacterium sputi]|uniref:hypothetical protein n=1 Tax=Corynebacterium sputi TaxID=489915 RepID=UPI00047C3E05|nr:hypothetical protein [Corynebacterium sputi]